MDFSINTSSPEEKIKKYYELNQTDSNPGYIDYIPNDTTSKAQPIDLPKGNSDYVSMFNPRVATSPAKPAVKAPVVPAVEPPAEPKQDIAAPLTSYPYKAVGTSGNAKTAYDYYVNEKKLAPHIAAGIIGNLQQESDLKPTAIGDGGTSKGIAQWHGSRWTALQSWANKNGRDPLDLHTQLDYILAEPGQENAIKKTMTAKDSDEATMLFGRSFERPKESAARWDVRQAAARALFSGK